MDNKKILYIGPYNEESNRGRFSLTNLRALHKKKYLIRAVPIYYPGEYWNDTPEDLLELEHNNFDTYDICIQDCDPLQYSLNCKIKKHIGIYSGEDMSDDRMLNTRMCLLDKVVVTSKKLYNNLSRILSQDLKRHIQQGTCYIDLEHVLKYKKDVLDWSKDGKYYFYTEVIFNDTYDWEKLIYVYMNNFMKRNCGLIIKTFGIETEEDAINISRRIDDIAYTVNVSASKENGPKILSGIYDEESTMKLYNSIDCFIDCNKTNQYNNNILKAAALKKDIICNAHLAASEFFEQSYKVDAYPCNINKNMYSKSYSMETNSLRDTMLKAYSNRYDSPKVTKQELEKHDISNIDNLLC